MNMLPNFNMIGTNRINGGGGSVFPNTYSLAFDGVDDYVDCGDVTAINGSTTMSSFAWVKIGTLAMNKGIMAKWDYNTQGCFAMQLSGITAGSDELQVFIADTITSVGSDHTYTTGANLVAGTWYYVGFVYDGSLTNTDRVKIYVDGLVQTTTTANTIPTSLTTATSTFKIGKFGGTLPRNIDANIDEVSVWSSALTDLQVSNIYNSGTPTDLSALAGLTNWYRNGDNGTWQQPQWLIPSNENKDKVSNYSTAFDGIDDKITTGLDCSSLRYPNLTVSYWIKIPLSTPYFTGGGANVGTSASQFYSSLGAMNGGSKMSYKANGVWIYGTNIKDNLWHNIVNVYEYDSGTYIMTVNIYLDGNPTPDISTSSYTPASALVGPLTIGASVGSTGNIYPFCGQVDEVAVWGTALTTADVATIYNSGTPTTLPSGAIAHYKMGEGSVFTNNWLVDNSATTAYSTRSFNFDGVDDSINCGNNSSLHNPNFTISVWVYNGTLTGNAMILQNGHGLWNSAIYGFRVRRSYSNYHCYIGDGTTYYLLNFTGALADTWQNIVLTYDGTDAKTYLNSEPKNTLAIPNISYGSSIHDQFQIGRSATNIEPFLGKIDEVSLFSTAKTQSEITAIYNGGNPSEITGATSWWRMGEDANYNAAVGVSGNTTADDAAGDLLIDTGVDFTTLNVEIGDLVRNTTTSSISRVNTIAATQLTLDDAIFPSLSSPDGYKITGPVVWTVPDSAGSNTGTSANMAIQDMVGEAPNYKGGGTSSNMYIEDRIGEAPNSTNNALSLNMDEVDREPDTPPTP